MSQDLSYLVADADSVDITDSLAQLNQLCTEWREAKLAVEEAEAALNAAKKHFNAISQDSIPQLLLQHGLSEIKLSDGSKVRVTQELQPTVKDMDRFVAFLESRGESSIVKTEISLGKLDSSVVKIIRRLLAEQLDLYPDIRATVHPMTLKKYIKELCGIGQQNVDERCIPLQDLPDCVSAFTYYKTNIKDK